MRSARIGLSIAIIGIVTGAGSAAAAEPVPGEPALAIWIEKDAQVSAHGGLTFRVHVMCGPLPGSHDFREGHAGAGQTRTGAGGEGGFTPDMECDGTRRVYTADVSLITEERFRAGPASASAAVIACNVVGDDQVCVQGAAHRTVIIRGPVPR